MARRRRAAATTSASEDSLRAPKVPRRHRYNTRSRSRRAALLGGDQEGRKPLLSDEEFRDRFTSLKVIAEGKALVVESIEKNLCSNADAHFTSDYESTDLVVRRGMPFDLTLTFDREVNKEADTVTLQFSVGHRPQESKGTLIRLKLDVKGQSKVTAPMSRWSATVGNLSGARMEVAVWPPANAIIGKYQVFVESRLTGNSEKAVNRTEWEDEDVVVIFNPWCPDDVVFMSDPRAREEYVLNEKGRIWTGSAQNNSGRPWNFGQFDNPCLEAAMLLLDKAELGDSARRSPISVVRAISALANSNDDNGVLEGRWTETYPKSSTVPWAWTGSVQILQEFMDSKKPVKYGQCWVFSGLVTTLLRALGIPTRSITNFESAHDCDASMTIDNHYDEDDEAIPELNDSVWNFHVWNESWFKRQDLPDGYDGWQAHDATPQELSEGVMRCGPAPLRAIKEGHVYLNYDVPFIFSEVNGDRVHWKRDENGDSEVVYVDSYAVGKQISTKCIGSSYLHDVTKDYKYPEGTEEERRVVEFVNRFSKYSTDNIYKRENKEDVKFKVSMPNAVIGDDVTVSVTLTNNSGETRKVMGRMSILSAFYTGVPAKRLTGQGVKEELAAGEEKTLSLTVTADEYEKKLNPEASMQAYAAFTVAGTKQHFVSTRAFTLSKPVLTLTVPDDMKAGEEYQGTVSFTNPLAINLTNGVIHLESASVLASDVYKFGKPIKPEEEVSYTFTLKPRRAGSREVDATFSCDQLCGVDGSVEFEVTRNVQPMDTTAAC